MYPALTCFSRVSAPWGRKLIGKQKPKPPQGMLWHLLLAPLVCNLSHTYGGKGPELQAGTEPWEGGIDPSGMFSSCFFQLLLKPLAIGRSHADEQLENYSREQAWEC